MGMTSIWHWLVVLLIVMLLFGAGRISGMMGDLGKGIKSFKKGLNEEDEPVAAPPPRITDERVADPQPVPQPAADLDKR